MALFDRFRKNSEVKIWEEQNDTEFLESFIAFLNTDFHAENWEDISYIFWAVEGNYEWKCRIGDDTIGITNEFCQGITLYGPKKRVAAIIAAAKEKNIL
ncbi:MAG: hypothetical protein GY765_40650 [bacterium]|nr:hypothetical protein [bacterium]